MIKGLDCTLFESLPCRIRKKKIYKIRDDCFAEFYNYEFNNLESRYKEGRLHYNRLILIMPLSKRHYKKILNELKKDKELTIIDDIKANNSISELKFIIQDIYDNKQKNVVLLSFNVGLLSLSFEPTIKIEQIYFSDSYRDSCHSLSRKIQVYGLSEFFLRGDKDILSYYLAGRYAGVTTIKTLL